MKEALRADETRHMTKQGGRAPALFLQLSPNCATPRATAHSAHYATS
jgi:hypothetical protein